MKEIVVATTKRKLKEISECWKKLGISKVCKDVLGYNPDIEETRLLLLKMQ